MIKVKTLEHESIDKIHECFLKAFHDYEIPMNPSLETYSKMLKRRGYKPNLSVGLYDDNQLVGFITNGSDRFDGNLCAYDIGTGVIKEYRQRGYSSKLFDEVNVILKSQDIKSYQLEVLENNTSAKNLYLKQGFKVERKLLCFKKENLNNKKIDKSLPLTDFDLMRFTYNLKFKPSFQNSISSVLRLKEEFFVYSYFDKEKLKGFIVFNKESGDVPLIHVSDDDIIEEIYTTLLTEALSRVLSSSLTLLNIDENNQPLINVLNELDFTNFINQFEMKLKL